MTKTIRSISPYLGCDPEFFFKQNGAVVGAEKFLPKEGLESKERKTIAPDSAPKNSKFIIDGVQAELNPRPDVCRARLANEISECFKVLKKSLEKHGGSVTADFSRTIEISKENLMELDEKSRQFGCAPSRTVYRNKAGIKLDKVDSTEYRVRAAGGHIHIGLRDSESGLRRALTTDHRKTVRMLDLIVGNTCVLIDRDPSNIERRKLYGRAGEFRLPKHGLEYRTLSNFWLTSYPLTSFVLGMTRVAVEIIADSNHEEHFEHLTKLVKSKDVKEAINNNDFDLAMKNFKKIEEYFLSILSEYNRCPIDKTNIKQFHYFVKKVNSEGLNYWFPQDPLEHWVKLPEGHNGGFRDFMKELKSIDLIQLKSILRSLLL